nr:uncharacterized protein LOC109733186 [Aegilops tauschii subsp. strangulata]
MVLVAGEGASCQTPPPPLCSMAASPLPLLLVPMCGQHGCCSRLCAATAAAARVRTPVQHMGGRQGAPQSSAAARARARPPQLLFALVHPCSIWRVGTAHHKALPLLAPVRPCRVWGVGKAHRRALPLLAPVRGHHGYCSRSCARATYGWSARHTAKLCRYSRPCAHAAYGGSARHTAKLCRCSRPCAATAAAARARVLVQHMAGRQGTPQSSAAARARARLLLVPVQHMEGRQGAPQSSPAARARGRPPRLLLVPVRPCSIWRVGKAQRRALPLLAPVRGHHGCCSRPCARAAYGGSVMCTAELCRCSRPCAHAAYMAGQQGGALHSSAAAPCRALHRPRPAPALAKSASAPVFGSPSSFAPAKAVAAGALAPAAAAALGWKGAALRAGHGT